MPTLLHLRSSADTRTSTSRALGDAFVEAWKERGDDRTVIVRDLHRDPIPHLADASLHWPARLRPADADSFPEAEALQRELLDELIAADALLVEAPMYNYSLPSSLKAWIDHIHVPGITAPFDEPTQPLVGRPAVILSSRGGSYAPGEPTAEWDHTIPPLRIVLADSLGMRVDTVVAELTLARAGLALTERLDESRAQLDAALRRARELGASI